MPGRDALVKNLTIDAMTAKVVTALAAADVSCLLLRGPVVARRLYREAEVRPYADCDLLLPRAELARAEAVVAGLGMSRDATGDVLIPEWEHHHNDWQLERPRFDLELHWTLMLVGAEPDALWRVFTRGSQTLLVGGAEVRVPGDPQLAVMLALHAVQHRVEGSEHPQEDLRRALDRFSPDTWSAAAACAAELDAIPAFAAGLRLSPAGAELAGALALADRPTFEVMLATGRAGRGARQVDRLVGAKGLRAKLRLVWRGLFPPERLKHHRPIRVDRSRGLVLGYLALPFRAGALLAFGAVRWRRARRATLDAG